MAVSLLENLFLKYLGFDNEPVCNVCGSKKISIVETTQNKFITICESCKNEEEIELIEE
jgi:transcription elongation factor Elf1